MRFENLYSLYEASLSLVYGNYGRPISAVQYHNNIKSYISKRSKYGYSSVGFFLGKPDSQEKLYLELVFHITSSLDIPEKNYQIKVPQKTLNKFRTNPQIYNRNNVGAFKRDVNVFYLNNEPIKKIFPDSEFEAVMEKLIKVNDFFISQYGKEYSFLGDIYTMREGGLIQKLMGNLSQNKADILSLPQDFKGLWQNIIQ